MCFAPHQKSYAGNSNYTGKYDFRTLLLFLRFNLVKIHIYIRIPSPAEKLSSEELRKGPMANQHSSLSNKGGIIFFIFPMMS